MSCHKKNKYIETPFDDVDENDWFAPFVGYCYQNGIIKGFGDGSFRPDDFVSEKAFLTMVLGSLNYEADKDFDWDTVLQKAYEVGLVENIEYAVRTEDNTNYLRENVVHTIYMSLKKPIDGETRTVVERMIDRKATNKVIAKKYDLLIEDEQLTELVSAKVSGDRKIVLEFNEEIARVTQDQVNVLSDDEPLSITKIVQESKTVTVEMDNELYEGQDYKIVLSNIKDSMGFTAVEDFEKKF